MKTDQAEAMYDFHTHRSVEELARIQGVQPVSNPDDLKADFWPEDELDAFLAEIEARRAKYRPQ